MVPIIEILLDEPSVQWLGHSVTWDGFCFVNHMSVVNHMGIVNHMDNSGHMSVVECGFVSERLERWD